jgi:hypothetical protein
MKLLLGILGGLLVLLGAGAVLLFVLLRRWASSKGAHELVESLDTGLAIPMRDSDTRRSPKERES